MKSFDVLYEGKTVGTVAVQNVSGGVRFDAVCTLSGEAVLRLYGERDGSFLPVGVLAPHGGYWHIGRTVSRQTLQQLGFSEALPERFLLSEQPPQANITGDRLIDAALRRGAVELHRTAGGCEISCPFDPTVPSPLAFALTACTVRGARAVLQLKS